jgi:tyrosinase
MAAVRRNIVTSAAAREAYVRGVNLLKREPTGITTDELGLPGTSRELGTYDLFIYWHQRAMHLRTPPNHPTRNAAHSGPAFLPWHRYLLIALEAQLQRVLADANFGLPYWDWAADGERPLAQQAAAPIWNADCMGGNGDALTGNVSTGPFSASSGWRVRIAGDSNDVLRSTSRPLRRRFRTTFGLPKRADVAAALARTSYDVAPWTSGSAGFRNRLEGWAPSATAPNLHNRVHVWVAGDMEPSSSPNDPVFFLNHCNVDRIWAAWRAANPARLYVPAAAAPAELFRHRIDDPQYSVFTGADNAAWTPRRLLDVSSIYSYDTLIVA